MAGTPISAFPTQTAISLVNDYIPFIKSIGGGNFSDNRITAANLLASMPTANGYAFCTVSSFISTSPLPANTYANGAAGVGATLTGNVNGALTINGGTPTAGSSRVIVNAEVAAANNGIYLVTQVGDASHPYILTRSTYFNTNQRAATGIYGVSETDPTYGNTRWLFTNPGTITFGTTAINFTQWTKPLLYFDTNSNLALAGFSYEGNSCPVFNGRLDIQAPLADYGLVIEACNVNVGAVAQYGLRIDVQNALATDLASIVYDHSAVKYLHVVYGDGGVSMSTALSSPGPGNLTIAGMLNVAGTSIPVSGIYRSPLANGGFGLSMNSLRTIETAGTTNQSVYISTNGSNTQDFIFNSGAFLYLDTTLGTTANAANLVADTPAGGYRATKRSTSSIRNKVDVRSFGPEVSGPLIDALEGVTYRSACKGDNPQRRHYGMIAEHGAKFAPELATWVEVETVDQSKPSPEGYATWADYITENVVSGKVPEWWQYERVVPILVVELKSLRKRIADLERRPVE